MSEKIVCPQCHHSLDKRDPAVWKCSNCGYIVPLMEGKPVFSGHPQDQVPQEKIERSADKGTDWRRANWSFIEEIAALLPPGSDVLDVGAGRGDFKGIFSKHAYLGMDMYPYPEIDLAADLIEVVPFKPASFDLVVLANVIEHVYDYRLLIARCADLLRPGGSLLITVPFLLKLHQEPVDYHRYTRYAISRLAAENQLNVARFEAYTNPLAHLDEAIGDVWQHVIPVRKGAQHFTTKARVALMQKLANSVKTGKFNGVVKPAAEESNPYVLGYMCLFTKPQLEAK
jgi:SAM-dependent methyltransferase